MKKLTAYIVVLTINLEPVYGIILAFLFFGDSELMSPGFYFGTLIILASVIGYPVYLHHLRQSK
jgi:drug/metabolite transporter (DMT)-like permease